MKASFISAALLVFALSGARPLAAQNGSDINQAIPIYFGQITTDIIDEQLKEVQVYSIALAQGQRITALASTTIKDPSWCLSLWSPNTRTIANWACNQSGHLAWAGYNDQALTFDYLVPASGKYYVVLRTARASNNFKLQVTAQGTPILSPNPATAGCLSGRVDYLTYSLQLIAAGLADEASIGGQKICANCTVKAPQYPEIVNRLENALRSRLNVEACYDSAGAIFQIKLVQP